MVAVSWMLGSAGLLVCPCDTMRKQGVRSGADRGVLGSLLLCRTDPGGAVRHGLSEHGFGCKRRFIKVLGLGAVGSVDRSFGDGPCRSGDTV